MPFSSRLAVYTKPLPAGNQRKSLIPPLMWLNCVASPHCTGKIHICTLPLRRERNANSAPLGLKRGLVSNGPEVSRKGSPPLVFTPKREDSTLFSLVLVVIKR